MNTVKEWQDEFSHLQSLKGSFLTFLKDTNIPVDDRWTLFIDAPDSLVNHNDWVVGDDFWPIVQAALGGAVSWFDDFYCDRHSILDVDTIIERLIEEHEEFFTANPTKLDELKEDMLAKGVRSFTCDW